MKYLFSDILRTKISAFAGKSLLFHFPAKEFSSSLFLNSRFGAARLKIQQAIHELVLSFETVILNGGLNNQRFNQQSNQQQQIRMT